MWKSQLLIKKKEEIKMKRFIKYYILSLLVTVINVACTDDLIVRNEENIREGVSVTVSLDFGVSASKIVTRAAEREETERTVNRIYLFVFNSDGSLDNKQLYSINQSTTGCIETITNFPMHSGYDKRFYAIANPTSGSGTLDTDKLAVIETEAQLLNVTSSLLEPINIERSYFLMSGKMESEIEGGQINVTENGQISGAKVCEVHSKPVIALERVDARITFKIKGENSVYKNFQFIPDRYWVENIPQHTYVFPHEDDYMTDSRADDYASMSEDGENGVHRNVEGQDGDGFYYFEFYLAENRQTPKQLIEEKGDAENLYALREKKDKIPLTDNELIESDKNGQEERNGEFTYANPFSTYVVFHGTLTYTDESEGESQTFVYADAEYTIHLGDTGGMGDDGHENQVSFVNNYNTNRNTHYTYTIKITGVNSMVVEVEAEEGDAPYEDRPGVEGDVIFSGDAVEEMDAHYGRTQFTLRRGDIKNGLSWAIRTPFQSGMKFFEKENYLTNDDGTIKTQESDYASDPNKWKKLQTDLELNDYKWVQFLINMEAGFTSEQFAKYPGYASYVGENNENAVITEAAPPFGGEGAIPPVSNDSYKDRDKKVILYDVNQLMNHLYAEALNPTSEIFVGSGDDAIVTITAFVDEYVYVYDPTKIYYRSPEAVEDSDVDGIDLKLWKKVANRDNRMLYICTSGAIYSKDGETSVSRNVFTIAQKPVYTFYNTNDEEVVNGWGTESVNETGPISAVPEDYDVNDLGTNRTDYPKSDKFSAPKTYPNDTQKGLINTLAVLYKDDQSRNLKWTDIMTLSVSDRVDDVNGTFNLNDKYDNIWYACIARNRDLNGDNKIDDKEVRWYLASIDQLTDIWVGQWSLNESAWLYHGDGTIRSHIASSSYYYGGNIPESDKNACNPFVIWGEEGASRGALQGSYRQNGTYVSNNTNANRPNEYGGRQNFHYRCVRNLGISLNNPTDDFTPYANSTLGKYVNDNDEEYEEVILDLNRIESNSIRSAIVQDAEQPNHTEREYTNRPYRKFAVIKNKDFSLKNGGTGTWSDYQNKIVCPQGYRMPNQRELMIMYMYADQMTWLDVNSNAQYVCRTGFGFNEFYKNSDSERPGFMYELSTGLLFLETEYTDYRGGRHQNGYVRCVRDVSE